MAAKPTIALLACLLRSTSSLSITGGNRRCSGVTSTFSDFVAKYGRAYAPNSAEYARREAVFNARVENIDSHNCNPAGPWNAGVNHLADWTDTELRGLLGHKPARRARAPLGVSAVTLAAFRPSFHEASFPDTFSSWANLSSIQETWDQGNCGSCWAVAATTVMRSHAEIKGLRREFSAHQIVACTLNPNECGGKGGCDGSTAELAYEYVLRAGVVAGDSEFRQIGGEQTTCPAEKRVATERTTEASFDQDGTEVHRLSAEQVNMRGRDIGMVGWVKLPENKEASLVRALVEQGPVYVAVAVGSSWFSYAGGVMTPAGCDAANVVNHAVTLYGYGIKPKTRIGDIKYWHIKNSWGGAWGEQGSVRLQRLDEEEKYCGWDEEPQEGSGCRGGPPRVWVCGSCGILYDSVLPTFVG